MEKQKYVKYVNEVVLVSSLSTLNKFHTLFGFSIIGLEQVIAGWVGA